jgi:hypothetical protein
MMQVLSDPIRYDGFAKVVFDLLMKKNQPRV